VLAATDFDMNSIVNERYKATMVHCKSMIIVKRDSLSRPYPMENKQKVLDNTKIHVRESCEEILKLIEE